MITCDKSDVIRQGSFDVYLRMGDEVFEDGESLPDAAGEGWLKGDLQLARLLTPGGTRFTGVLTQTKTKIRVESWYESWYEVSY